MEQLINYHMAGGIEPDDDPSSDPIKIQVSKPRWPSFKRPEVETKL